MKTIKFLAFAILSLLILSAVPTSAHGSAVLVEDQEIGHGNVFVIQSLNITEDTLWVVVHHDENGSPGGIEANESVSEGHYTNYNFTFHDIDHDETLWVMLHNDTVADGVFNPSEDVPRTKHDEIIMDDFVLSAHGHDDESNGGPDEGTEADTPGFLLPVSLLSIAMIIVIRKKEY